MYIHCCAHSLNLAIQDATRSCTIIRDALEFVQEVLNFVKASPLRSRIFHELKADYPSQFHASGLRIRPLCPTKWTVRSKAIQSIADNYEALLNTFDVIAERNTDDAAAKASGFVKRLNNFEI